MEHIAAMEEKMVSDRLRRKLEEVNVAAREQLAPIQDHVNFTLQQAYFKCAYECFDRRRQQEDISSCVEHCSVPVLTANNRVEEEMAKFQERMQRALMVCQDRFEEAKLHKIKTAAISDLESCVDHAIQDSIKALPRAVDRLKASFLPRLALGLRDCNFSPPYIAIGGIVLFLKNGIKDIPNRDHKPRNFARLTS